MDAAEAFLYTCIVDLVRPFRRRGRLCINKEVNEPEQYLAATETFTKAYTFTACWLRSYGRNEGRPREI